MTRDEWLASDEFEKALTKHFAEAATKAVHDLRSNGVPVHGRIDGRPATLLPYNYGKPKSKPGP